MTPEAAGTAQGREVVRLLWDPPSATAARGPRPKLTLVEIVAAGIQHADAEGLAALSMRKVAQRLGVGAMSLYTYLPGRTELVELMIDAVYGETTALPGEHPWRKRLEHWCHQTWELYARHPWLLDYNDARLPIGPHVLDNSEDLYATLMAAGFAGSPNVSVANLIRWQLLGAARSTIGDADEARRTGVTAEGYWNSRDSFWTTYFRAERYPAMAAIHEVGGFDDPAGWDIDRSIGRLIDGIDQLREQPVADRDQSGP